MENISNRYKRPIHLHDAPPSKPAIDGHSFHGRSVVAVSESSPSKRTYTHDETEVNAKHNKRLKVSTTQQSPVNYQSGNVEQALPNFDLITDDILQEEWPETMINNAEHYPIELINYITEQDHHPFALFEALIILAEASSNVGILEEYLNLSRNNIHQENDLPDISSAALHSSNFDIDPTLDDLVEYLNLAHDQYLEKEFVDVNLPHHNLDLDTNSNFDDFSEHFNLTNNGDQEEELADASTLCHSLDLADMANTNPDCLTELILANQAEHSSPTITADSSESEPNDSEVPDSKSTKPPQPIIAEDTIPAPLAKTTDYLNPDYWVTTAKDLKSLAKEMNLPYELVETDTFPETQDKNGLNSLIWNLSTELACEIQSDGALSSVTAEIIQITLDGVSAFVQANTDQGEILQTYCLLKLWTNYALMKNKYLKKFKSLILSTEEDQPTRSNFFLFLEGKIHKKRDVKKYLAVIKNEAKKYEVVVNFYKNNPSVPNSIWRLTSYTGAFMKNKNREQRHLALFVDVLKRFFSASRSKQIEHLLSQKGQRFSHSIMCEALLYAELKSTHIPKNSLKNWLLAAT